MNRTKTLLIRVCTVLVLAAIAVLMYFLGRGHTVYFDNKKLEYNGTTYDTPYKVEVYVGGERIAKLYDRERGATTCIGSNFSMDLVVTQEKGGSEQTFSYSFKLPYSMDGIVYNLPGLLAGLPEEAIMSEFVSTVEEVPADEEVVTDEFGMTMDGMDESADPDSAAAG